MTTALDKTIGVSELRSRIKEVLEACARRGVRFNISSNSESVAVLVGIAEWKMLNETLDILADRDLLKQVKRSEEAIKSGDTYSAEDVFSEIDEELDKDG